MPALFLCLQLALLASTASAAPVDSIIADIPDVDDEQEEEGYEYDHGMDMGMGMGMGGMYAGGYYYHDGDMTEVDQGTVQLLFEGLDINHDGRLSEAELKRGLEQQAEAYVKSAKISSREEASQIVAAADMDADGRLSVDEFLNAEVLYLHHDGGLQRRQLFEFADAGGDGTQSPDGALDAAELQVLVFPDFSPRRDEFRQWLAGRVTSAHDANQDEHLDKHELFGFHSLKLGLPSLHELETGAPPSSPEPDDGEGGRAAAPAVGGRARWRNQPYHHADYDDKEAEEGDYKHEDVFAEFAAHNDTFDWHDHDSNGMLDSVELGEYLVPTSSHVPEGYVEEELGRLLSRLSSGGSAGAGDGSPPPDAGEGFVLNHVISMGRGFLDAFEAVASEMADGVVGDEETDRDL